MPGVRIETRPGREIPRGTAVVPKENKANGVWGCRWLGGPVTTAALRRNIVQPLAPRGTVGGQKRIAERCVQRGQMPPISPPRLLRNAAVPRSATTAAVVVTYPVLTAEAESVSK